MQGMLISKPVSKKVEWGWDTTARVQTANGWRIRVTLGAVTRVASQSAFYKAIEDLGIRGV